MRNYQNITKEELIIAFEKLQQLNELLVSSNKKKEEKKHDVDEQKLQKKDLLFRKLSANVPDLIFQFTRRTDGSYFVPIASEGIKNIFGCSPEDVLNDFTPIANVIYPEDAKRVIDEIEYSAKHLTYFTCEFRVQLPGKEIQWILSKSTPEKQPDGCVTWYGFNANITERKKAEQKLKKAMILLQSSIESPKDMIILSIDKNYNYLYFNECHRLTMLYAYGQDVKIGMNLLECITSEEDSIKAKINYDKALNGESHITIQEYGDIEKSYYETRYNPIFNDINEIIGTTAFSADITERKLAEKKMQEQNVYIKMILDNFPIGIATNEIDSMKVTYMNRKFSEIYGWPEDDFPSIGEFFEKVFPDLEYRQQLQTKILADISSGDSERMNWDNLKITTKAGNQRIVYAHNIPLVSQNIMVSTVQDITERKNAERERHKFAMLADSSSEFIGMCDLNLQPIYVNPSGIRMLGLPDLAEACRVRVQDYFFPEDQRFIVEEFFPRVLSEGEGDVEIRLRHFKTGAPIWMLYYLFRVSDDNNKPVGWATVSRDITERKQAVEKLRESESRYRKIYEDGANGMVMVGKDFKFITANRTFCKMVGYREEELQQLTFVDITHPDDKTKEISQVKKMMAGEMDVYRTEKRFLNKNGQTIWAQLTASPIYDSKGQFLYNLGMIINITEQKNAELDLLRMSQLMKNSQKIAHLGSFEYVAASQTTIWSEEEFRIYGLDPNGPSPEYHVMLEKCIHPDDAKLLHDSFMTAIQNQGVYKLEHRIVRPDGSIRWVYDQAKPEYDEQGALLRYVGATLDITERKNATEEITRQLEELRRWHQVTLGREGRVQELKQEVNELLRQHGETLRYGNTIQENPDVDKSN